jgi:phage/conjugal plasmid C-4 type zinc finger TraR family protein
MGDIADNADKTIADHLEAAIRAARGVMPADTRSAETCAECGLEIPAQRRQAIPGVQTCFDCAVELESRKLRGLL